MSPAPSSPAPSRPWRWGALAALAAFWALLQASLWDKSSTYDELVHATAGWTYWRWDDYRLNPEAGNLPERVAALPLLAGRGAGPPRGAAWRTADEWTVADAWFHGEGNDFRGMLRRGRAAAGLLAVALAALVWAAAARRFGPAGGALALIACVLNPAILANGALMTSDAAAALGFLAAALAIWSAFGHLSAGRVALAGLALGSLLVSKMSAVVIVPVALVLAAARLAAAQPLPVAFAGRRRELRSRWARLAATAAAAAAAIAIAIAVVWAFYGFRYAARSPAGGACDRQPSWEKVLGDPPQAGLPRLVDAARRRELLPEAYLYGCAYAWRFSRWRDGFLNGEHSLRGRPGFFPYLFLVKTPWPLFGLLALAAGATAARWRARRDAEGVGLGRQLAEGLWATLPLWALIAADSAAAILSPLNIGLRHLLPVYPPLFILCGAALAGGGGSRRRLAGWLTAALVAWSAVEAIRWFPDYLAYVNGTVRPAEAYRHFVDSSLDWGQDLPAAARYIDRHPADGPFYLSYFGSGSPEAYGVRARATNCAMPGDEPEGSLPVMTRDFPPGEFAAATAAFLARHPEYELAGTADVDGGQRRGIFLKKAPELRLHPGTYLISATVLQQMEYNLRAPWGPWNRRFEDRYQRLRGEISPLMGDDPAARRAALARGSIEDWWRLLKDAGEFDALRFARLAAYLRRRPPDGSLHGSILVFRLDAAELRAALEGPPPELGRDMPQELARSGLLR